MEDDFALCQEGYQFATLTVSSFNIGTHQDQLRSARSWRNVCPKMVRIVERFFDVSGVNVACLSEFGHYREGPHAQALHVEDLFIPKVAKAGGAVGEGAFYTVWDTSCILQEE